MKTKLLFFCFAICGITNAQIAITMSQSNIACNGQCDGTAGGTPTGGTAPYTYLWSPSGKTTASVTGLCAGNYSLTVTDATSATGTATATITQPFPLSVTFTVTNASCSGCNDGSATAYPTGGVAPYTYTWMPAGQWTQTITGLPAGTYSVCVHDANGCYTCSPVLITQPNITANFSNTSPCFNNPTWFTDLSTSNNGSIIMWHWDFGDSIWSNLQTPSHVFPAVGTYTVCLIVTNSNGDKDTTCHSLTVFICSGIPIVFKNESINIFPNPFSSQTTLHTDKFFKNATLTVYNSFGQQVKQIKNISGQTVTLHRNNLPSGLYFIRLTENDKTFATEKLVITDN